MSTLQMSIDGKTHFKGNIAQEVRDIINTYPDYADKTGKLLYVILKKRYAWISQLDGQRITDLKDFLDDVESIRRVRQYINSELTS